MDAKHWWTTGALGLTLCISATSVQADIRSWAELGELQFSVFDLDPLDGIDAGYTLFPEVGLTEAFVGANSGPESQFTADRQQGWLAPLSLHVALSDTEAATTVDGTLRTEGHTPAEPNNSYGGSPYSTTNVLVAPHTRLDISAPYQISLSFGDFAPTADTWGWAHAQAGLHGLLDSSEGEDVRSFSVNLTIDDPDAPLSLFDEGTMRISLANDSDDSRFANLVVDVSTSGNVQVRGPGPPPITPIPEPGSAVLSMVGLGILIRKSGALTAVRHAVRRPSSPKLVVGGL